VEGEGEFQESEQPGEPGGGDLGVQGAGPVRDVAGPGVLDQGDGVGEQGGGALVEAFEELVGEGEFVVGAHRVGDGGDEGHADLGDGAFAGSLVLFGLSARGLEGDEGLGEVVVGPVDVAEDAVVAAFPAQCGQGGGEVAGDAGQVGQAVSARSVALAGFGLDSLIEIGASTVVIWELSGTGEARQRRALRLIGFAFAALALYLLVQSTVVLAIGYHPQHSTPGIAWTAITVGVMFTLAAGKARTGAALDNPVLKTEGRGTLIDGVLAAAVLLGLVLNASLNWWWADPLAGYVLAYYAGREVREIFSDSH
jgi:hypothetical protein